jgi:hypothetical protein
MRPSTTGRLASAALLSLAGCQKPAAPAAGPAPQAASAPTAPASGPIALESLPHRKAGLWRQTMTLEGAPQGLPASEFCIDSASEAKMSMLGQQMSKDHCQTPQFTRNLDGSITFSSSCDFGDGHKTNSTGTISGDYNSSYQVAIDAASAGGPASGEHRMTMTATWEGPCKPGQTGGDIILPGGRTMNMIKGR